MPTPTHIFLKILFIGALCVSTFSNHASASTIITENISENTTWDVNGNPFVVQNSINIESGATLTIEPGVVVKFEYGAEFGISGEVVANGAVGSEIIFTSLYDDSFLGDTNGDGFSEGLPGDWFGVSVYPGGNISLSNASVRFASFGFYADQDSIVNFSSVTLDQNFIVAERHVGANISLQNISYLNNFQDAHFIFGSTDGLSGSIHFDSGVPYVLYESFYETPIFDATFSAGAILKFYDYIVDASFTDTIITGTESEPVIFTSYYDDSAGGDTDGGIDPSLIFYDWGNLDFSGNISISNLIVRYENFGVDFNDAVGTILESSISDSLGCADFWGNSIVDITGFSCTDTSVGGLSLWDYSSVDFSNIEIHDSYSGISLFENSSISGSQLTVENSVSSGSALELYDNSSAIISNLQALGYGFDALDISDNVSLTLSNSVIRNYNQVGYLDTTGNISFDTTNMRDLNQGIYVNNVGILSVSNSAIVVAPGSSAIYNNPGDFISAINNWWGSASGPFHTTQNPGGMGGQIFGNNVSFSPWLLVDPYPESVLGVIELAQKKRDGLEPIAIGGRQVSEVVILKGLVTTLNGDNGRIEVEIKQQDTPFDGLNTQTSAPVLTNTVASVTFPNMVDGFYHWRARAVDSTNMVSPWVEFNGSSGYDFEIKQVPHYTQISSPLLTYGGWSNEQYANNTGVCNTIGKCGCAVTSVVMVLRNFGITQGIDGIDVNPESLNNWLKNQNDNVYGSGYNFGGNINWKAIEKYSGGHLIFNPGKITYKDTNLLNQYLESGNKLPILNVKGTSQPNGHFVVATNKLSDNNYEIKDPSWYLTKTLNEVDSTPNNLATNTIRDYDKEFVGLRVYEYFEESQNQVPYTIISVGSPVELLVTNSLGQKLGKDIVTGIEYNEIPGSDYSAEYIESNDVNDEFIGHTPKVAHINNPPENEVYVVSVMGTSDGEYSFGSLTSNSDQETSSSTQGGIYQGGIIQYSVNVENSLNPEVNLIQLPDTQSPKADIFLDISNWSTLIDGLDTSGEPILTQNNNVYTLTDLPGNTTSFNLIPNLQTNLQKKYTFSNFIQNGQLISIPLTRLEYTRQLGQQNILKKLIQKITIQGVVTIEAVYNESMGKTIITKTYPNPVISPVVTEIFDGVKIIHLTAMNGQVGYEY